MDFNYIKKLIKLFEESKVTELEIEEDKSRIKLSKRNEVVQQIPNMQPVYQAVPHGKVEIMPKSSETHSENGKLLHEIKSPIVGTFYHAPSPEADPFVKVGDSISVGSVLCIIEAMKLLNEIESDVSGKIIKVLVENGKPVEYNQSLFLIETV